MFKMSKILDLKLLSSSCTRNDYYYKTLIETANNLGLNFKAEKITDRDKIAKYHVYIRCMYSYCPGCNALNELPYNDVSSKYVPVLIINDKAVLHSCIFTQGLLEEALSKYIE